MEEKEKEAQEAVTDNVQAGDEEIVDSAEQKQEDTATVEDKNNDAAVDELQKDIDRLQKEKEEVYQRLLRIQAEFDNYKKRTQKEKEAERKYKAQDLVNELLPALDNFERALQVEAPEEAKSFIDGVAMVHRQFVEALKSQGVVAIESVDKEFDPNLHHAVMQVEDSEKESNIIVEELQKGYLLKDRVIRPAMVKVNK